MGAVVASVRDREARQNAIRDELAGQCPVPRLVPGRREQTRGVAKVAEILDDSGRAVLQRVLRGRITFCPRRTEQATSSVPRPVSTSCSLESRLRDRRGSKPRQRAGIKPDHRTPFDGDWGGLLAQAQNRHEKNGPNGTGFGRPTRPHLEPDSAVSARPRGSPWGSLKSEPGGHWSDGRRTRRGTSKASRVTRAP